jgi:hypothetical protein
MIFDVVMLQLYAGVIRSPMYEDDVDHLFAIIGSYK